MIPCENKRPSNAVMEGVFIYNFLKQLLANIAEKK
jgi:hypothetical protein